MVDLRDKQAILDFNEARLHEPGEAPLAHNHHPIDIFDATFERGLVGRLFEPPAGGQSPPGDAQNHHHLQIASDPGGF